MPHTASASKRLRKSERRRKQNRKIAKALKGRRRAIDTAVKAGDAGKLGEEARTTQTALDRAAAKGYIHPNKAARLKSRMAKKIKATAK